MSAYSEVSNAFQRAADYASSATNNVDAFAQTLADSIYSPPSISVVWNDIAPPSFLDMPPVPDEVVIAYNEPTGEPGVLAIDPVTTSFDTFTENAPDIVMPTDVDVVYGDVPIIPDPADVAMPTEPTLAFPAEPTFLTMNTVTLSTVDLHPEYLANLETIPALDLMEPTPYSYALGAEYASALLTALQSKLATRLNGGTGLDPTVEQAIWDRARDREAATAQGNIDEVQRTADALGFQLPSGVVAARIREAQAEYYDKTSTISRDIAIKQAELEQANLKDTIAAGMQLESKLIDYAYQMERLAFENAKEYADNAVKIYNSGVEAYKALLASYQAYANAYDTIIKGELSKVEIYKAELQGELAKAQINSTLVAQYKATIEAQMAYVDIYKAQVEAAKTLVQIEGTKINAAAEQVRGFIAQVNAETAKVEAYKAQVQARVAEVDVYKTKVAAFSAKVGAQAEQAKTEVAVKQLEVQTYAAQVDGYKAKIAAATAEVEALSRKSVAMVDGFKAAAAAREAEARLQSGVWETQIKNYEASRRIVLETGKINTDALLTTNNARLEAAKAGASVYAQLAGSAYSIARATASIDARDSNSVNYNYGGDTNSNVTPVPLL